MIAMWRACLAAIISAFLLAPAAAQVNPIPQGTFQASPCAATGNIAPRVICPGDIASPLAGGTLPASVTTLAASGISTLTGLLNANGGVIVNNTTPGILVNKTASGQTSYFAGETAGVQRWTLILGNSTSESGSNVGSDFQLDAVTDAGADSGAAILCIRSTKLCTLNSEVVTNSFANNNIISTEFPGLTTNVEATGDPGLDNPSCASLGTCEFMIFASPTTPAASTASTVRIQRDASAVTAGTSGLTKGALWVLGFSGKTANEFNWNAKFELHNKTLGTTGAQNTGAQSTVFKETPSGGGEVSASWGIATQCNDKQALANPTASCIGVEADSVAVSGSGTDTNLQRVGLQISAGTFPGTDTGVHVGRGLLFSIFGNSVIDHMIDIIGGAGSGSFGTLWTTSIGTVTAVNGIDWSGVTFSGFEFKTVNFLIDTNGNPTMSSGTPLMSFNPPAVNNRGFQGQTNGSLRWQVFPGNATAEGGANSGSDFVINAFTDGGGFIATPFTITRSTALVTIANGLKASSLIATNLVGNSVAPTISSGFCTSPSIVANNGTWAFTVNVGSACAVSTGTIGLTAATTGWVCTAHDITTPASNVIEQSGGTASTVVLTKYVRTTGVAGNFTSSDVLDVHCAAF